MSMYTYITSLILTVFIAPTIVFGAQSPTDFKSFVALISNLIGVFVIVVFALTLIAFIWGIIKGWIVNGGDAEGIQNGKDVLIVGVIVLAIMISIWGILAMFQSSLF